MSVDFDLSDWVKPDGMGGRAYRQPCAPACIHIFY